MVSQCSLILQGNPLSSRGVGKLPRPSRKFLLEVVPSSLPLPPPLPRKKRQISVGGTLGGRKISAIPSLWVFAELGRTCNDHSFWLPRSPEDEAYDEDGNSLQDFYDSDPPGAGSPASALHDAYALYYPAERRYDQRGLRGGPWTASPKEGGRGRVVAQSTSVFVKVLKSLFCLVRSHETDGKIGGGGSVWT